MGISPGKTTKISLYSFWGVFPGEMPSEGFFPWYIINGPCCTYLQAFSNLKLTPSAIDKSTPIHLYVEDKDHPLKNSGYEFLQVVQSKTFIIPCMPTHPDVIVSLWKQGRRIEAGDQYITFDPKVITYFLFKISLWLEIPNFVKKLWFEISEIWFNM